MLLCLIHTFQFYSLLPQSLSSSLSLFPSLLSLPSLPNLPLLTLSAIWPNSTFDVASGPPRRRTTGSLARHAQFQNRFKTVSKLFCFRVISLCGQLDLHAAQAQVRCSVFYVSRWRNRSVALFTLPLFLNNNNNNNNNNDNNNNTKCI